MSERLALDVDIVCVGLGPATGGLLTTLAPAIAALASPLQVICYERADGLAFGVSGAVTRARGIRASFPDVDLAEIPMAVPVCKEKLVYLLDPIGASRRPLIFRVKDRLIRTFGSVLRLQNDAAELPFTPKFMRKHDGMIFSLGQFNQWVSERITSSGAVQL